MFKDISLTFPCTLEIYHLYLKLNNLNSLSFCTNCFRGQYLSIEMRTTMKVNWRNNINQATYKTQQKKKIETSVCEIKEKTLFSQIRILLYFFTHFLHTFSQLQLNFLVFISPHEISSLLEIVIMPNQIFLKKIILEVTRVVAICSIPPKWCISQTPVV